MGHGNNYIGKYRLGRTIGEGTFAKVKLAVDESNGNQVAIKIINKEMVTESNLKSQASNPSRPLHSHCKKGNGKQEFSTGGVG